MKKDILKILRETGENPVSGQMICEKFGVTRQAVWKNISQLKENGYDIESVSNKGYRLISEPDILYGPDIESRMSENCICKSVECYQSIDSTNTRAKQLAESGAEEGTLIVADRQTAGKGRRGRSWSSESNIGIYMSLIVRPSISPASVSGLTLISALALAKAIKSVCGVESHIKWPNDIVIGKKKICGILTEMSSEMNYIHYAVVGIGINANTQKFPDDIADKASSIMLESGKKVDRAELIAVTMELFGGYYQKFVEAESLEPFIEEYNEILANRDKEVRILYGMLEDVDKNKTECGIAKGIDSDGALIVETSDGIRKVVSGEVSVRGIDDYV